MGSSIRFKRGTTAQRLAYTPAIGEPVVDTDTDTVFIGDGSKAGGHKVGGGGDTTDYTLYVVTSALGGTSTATGRQLQSGATTGTEANKLVNANATFTSALVNKTVYNTTDGTWAKITALDSATKLSLSANIMTTGENYVICDAADQLSTAYALPDSPYNANVTIRFSPGTFSSDATLIGKTAGGDKTITIQGDDTAAGGGTTLSGDINIYDRVTFAGGTNYNLVLSGKVTTNGGADITWNYCTVTAKKLFIYDNSINLVQNSTVTVGNDPTNVTSISSTVNTGYTLYVAPGLSYGGSDSTGDGLQMYSGSATSTTANKLVDSAANFDTDVVNKTLYNSTDDTWAKVTARDSATQLSLSADIMASGESYVIANAFATVQKAVDAIPAIINCETTIRISDGTFTENVIVQGKNYSGVYSLNIYGTLTLLDSLTASSGVQGSGATQGTVVRNAGTWTSNQRQHKLVTCTSGTNNGLFRVIDSNDTTTLTITGCWDAAVGTSTFKVWDWGTTIDGSTNGPAINIAPGQKNVELYNLKLTNSATAYPNYEGLYLDTGTEVKVYRTWFSVGGAYSSYQEAFSKLFLDVCMTNGNLNGMIANQARADIWRSNYDSAGGTSHIAVRSTQGSQVFVSRGTIIDNFDHSVGGAYADQLSNLIFFSATADGHNRVQNCTVGIGAAKQSNIQNNNSAVYVTYTGNGTDTVADSSSTKDY